MTVLIEERQLLSGIQRLRTENADLRNEIAAKDHKIRELSGKLAHVLSAQQARDVLDENAHLRAVNDALVKRNTILAAKQRCT